MLGVRCRHFHSAGGELGDGASDLGEALRMLTPIPRDEPDVLAVLEREHPPAVMNGAPATARQTPLRCQLPHAE